MAIELGTPGLSPALWGQGLVSLGHPSPLCFAQKQVVGIIVESAALRDGPPLDVNQGQGEERKREKRKWRQERRELLCKMYIANEGTCVLEESTERLC